MIIAFDLWQKKTFHFKDMEEAVAKTGLSAKMIQSLIDSGHKYKGWTFDIADD